MGYSLLGRAVWVCCGFVAALTYLSVHLIEIQIVGHQAALAKVASRAPTKRILLPQRGNILDWKGEVLATSRPLHDLHFDRHQFPTNSRIRELVKGIQGMELDTANRDQEQIRDCYIRFLARELARPLDMQESKLIALMGDTKKEFPLLKEKMPAQDARKLVEHFLDNKCTGLSLVENFERLYTNGNFAAHALGFVVRDLEGKVGVEVKGGLGVERSLDNLLAGEPGVRAWAGGNLVEDKPPVHGSNIVLTIDTSIQNLLERELDRQWKELRPKKLCVILMRPSTGEILALANRPSFDPGAISQMQRIEQNPAVWDNVAVNSSYEPGSTFKLVVHGAAIHLGLVSLDTEVDCHGGYYSEPGWQKALEDVDSGFGRTSVRNVIAHSLNTGTYEVAKKIDPKVYYNFIRSFGFGEKTGIQLSAEENGRVIPVERFEKNRFELSRLAMGYSVMATPLQILGVVNVIANGGSYVKPRIVNRAERPDGKIVAQMPPEILRQVISPKAASALADAMTTCVEKGSATAAQIPGYVVGGKTGTARKSDGTAGYKADKYLCSFAGFAGTAQSIDLIGIVMVDEPNPLDGRNLYGGKIAAPIFKEVAAKALFHMGIPADPTIAQAGGEQKGRRGH